MNFQQVNLNRFHEKQVVDNALKLIVFFALAMGFLAWWLYRYPYLDFAAYFAFNGDPYLRQLAPYGVRGYGIIHIPTLTLMFAIAGSTLLSWPMASLLIKVVDWMYERLDILFADPENDYADETNT